MPVNILVCIDGNYLAPLKTMLKSLVMNNPGERFAVYLLHSDLPQRCVDKMAWYCELNGCALYPVDAGSAFADAPVVGGYTRAIYYRLLAAQLLPPTLDRVLYLDCDTLIINPVGELYHTELYRYLFAGASHTGFTSMKEGLGRLRLGTEMDRYVNSGVLLMNLREMRERVRMEEIQAFLAKKRRRLALPDQDILNALYAKDILLLDDAQYNYDVRRFNTYCMLSRGYRDFDWVIANTVVLHFCGRHKPWQAQYKGLFASLYKHYAHLAARS